MGAEASPVATIYPTSDVPVYITGIAQPRFGLDVFQECLLLLHVSLVMT